MSGAAVCVAVAGGYAAYDGGGRWRDYATRVAAVGGDPVEVVLDRRLAERLKAHLQGLKPEQKVHTRGARTGTSSGSSGTARPTIARRTCARHADWCG